MLQRTCVSLAWPRPSPQWEEPQGSRSRVHPKPKIQLLHYDLGTWDSEFPTQRLLSFQSPPWPLPLPHLPFSACPTGRCARGGGSGRGIWADLGFAGWRVHKCKGVFVCACVAPAGAGRRLERKEQGADQDWGAVVCGIRCVTLCPLCPALKTWSWVCMRILGSA